jgi:hypothetical protein
MPKNARAAQIKRDLPPGVAAAIALPRGGGKKIY